MNDQIQSPSALDSCPNVIRFPVLPLGGLISYGVVSEVDFKGLKLPAIVDENDEFWFITKDATNLIGVKDHTTATKAFENDEKLLRKLGVPAQKVLHKAEIYY
ncbi:hypothetical protein [Seinonella peptonophila]|nr:hypothetical protein [Seinonella peptonophila]